MVEVVDVIVPVTGTEDERIMTACCGTIRRLEVAPHTIRDAGGADEMVIPSLGAVIHGGSIADEVVIGSVRPTRERYMPFISRSGTGLTRKSDKLQAQAYSPRW